MEVKLPPPTVLGRILVVRRFAFPPIGGLHVIFIMKYAFVVLSIIIHSMKAFWLSVFGLGESGAKRDGFANSQILHGF